MNVRELRKVLVVLIFVLCLMPMGAMATLSCVGTYDALDSAFLNGDTSCTLTGVVNSTLKDGNMTYFDKAISLTFSPGSSVRVNNTLVFNNSKSFTFGGTPNFTYDPYIATNFGNDSLIYVIGNSNAIPGLTLNMKAFTGTGINITGSFNQLTTTGVWNISGAAVGTGFNINGSSNTLAGLTGNISTVGFGVNISGSANTISFIANNISATKGKFGIMSTATGNTIIPEDSVASQFQRPTLLVYNGTSTFPAFPKGPGVAWFFYNSSQSTGSNMNVTMNISKSIPFVGNVSILANTSSVSSLSYVGGNPLGNWTNSTLTVVNGNSGGYIYNTTANVIFGNGENPTFVGVYYVIGNNTLQMSGGSYTQFVPLAQPAVFLNGNPNGNVPVLNITQTTNFTTINDFSNADLTFLMETPVHQFLAKITFTGVNMTDQDEATAIRTLGQSLINSTVGSQVGFNMSINTATKNTFNKSATLRTYPFLFTPFSRDYTKLYVTADGQTTRTLLWDGSNWGGSAGNYVDTSYPLSTGTENGQTYIEIHSLHFSTFDTDSNTPPSGPSDSGSSYYGGVSSTTPVATQSVTTQSVETPTPGTPTTIGVNVGGSSVITKVAVTGTGVNDVIVTALPHTDLPASITRPATTVYQYVTVSPARYTTISSATFNFNIPTSWLAEKGYTKNDIVLTVWDTDTKAWTTLPTSIISEKNGIITYQAITPHMSEFAIIYQKGVSAQAQANVTAIQTSVPLTTTTATVTTVPITRTATPTPTKTVAPAPTAPPTGGLPTTTIIIAVVALIIIVAGAFLVHRWWVRRQNPALFKDLE